MQPSFPAIEVRDLRRTYRRPRRMREALLHPRRVEWCEALRGVSLEVEPGEVLGILGPNGAGKTSLVKILSTLVLPSGGEACIFGHDVVGEARAVLSKIGLVLADERSFYWRLTVRQNLDFFATLNDLGSARRAVRIEETLEAVEILEWGDVVFSNLSAGIRQRVALARAMLTDPPLLLMDEPTNSLDPHASQHFRRWIKHELVERRGKTILLVTHDAHEAEELCGRVGILKRGRMEFLGTPDELASRHPDGVGFLLSVSCWRDELQATLQGAGLAVRPAGDTQGDAVQLSLSPAEYELSDSFSLLASHGIRVHSCEPLARSFSELVAEVLGPEGGTP